MARWEPDARGRMARAALELFDEVGYDETTVADIAARAGVTERTFFRYFTDKREVLFDGSEALRTATVEGVLAADHGPAFDLAAAGFLAGAAVLGERPRAYARKRAAVVAATGSLRERELLKMDDLGSAVAGALRERGVRDPVARLAAESGVTLFRQGFERWVGRGRAPDLVTCVREARDALRAVVGS